jgi:hypothetical protein
MQTEEEETSTHTRPIFFVVSVVMFLLSVCFQIYFFVMINDVLSAKENATEILVAIVEWIYLVGPSLTVATFAWGIGAISYLISWLRRETVGLYRAVFGICALVDLIVFLLVFTLGYG